MQRQRDSSAGELTYSSTALIEIYSEQPSLLQLAGTPPCYYGDKALGSWQTWQTAQIHGQIGLPARDPQRPRLGPWRQCPSSCCRRGSGTETPGLLLQPRGASHTPTNSPQHLRCTSAGPLSLPLKPLSCLVLKTHTQREVKQSILPPFCTPTPTYSFHGYNTCLTCWGNHLN